MRIVNVGIYKGGEAFLIITDKKSALIDSGFSFGAKEMIENIKNNLNGSKLDYVLLTHTHYDHASGSAYCKEQWPDVEIVAGEYAAKVFSKPSAIEVMRDMNEIASKDYNAPPYEDKLHLLQIDRTVKEGDSVDMGNVSLVTMEAPGHTRCSIAFYIPEKNMVILNETFGVHVNEEIVAPNYLVGYQISINFIERIIAMKPSSILIAHHGILSGAESINFMNKALECSIYLKDLIVGEHKKGESYDNILNSYKERFYTRELQETQPLKAFELNAKYLIPMVIKECCEE